MFLVQAPLLLVAALHVSSSPHPQQAPRDTAPEAVVVDLRIGRITGATVQAYRVRSEVLLPLSQFFQLAEIRHRLTPDGRLEATVDPGNRRIVIDPRSDSMEYGDRRVRIEREFIRFEAPELYVGSERLGDLLGVMFVVDWSDLTATVVDASPLPIASRLRREAAREAYLRRPDGMRPDVTLGLQRPSWDGVVIDYSLFSPSSDPVAGSTYGFGVGADVGGGSLEMLGQSVGPAELGRVHIDASWTGVWRESRWVKQLHLGDVPSSGPRSRPLEGFAITNAPFVRSSLVGSLRYAGSLEPGWSVEAYRGGELVAFDSASASGGFAIDLPVRYGENPVDFVAYGPFGEIREFNRTYRVLNELLPARQFEYGLSGGRCPQPSFTCNATANLDVRYGANRRWTVQGGLDQFWRDSLPDRTHPYVAIVGNPTNAWSTQTELVGAGFARGALRYEPSVDLRFEGEYVHFAHDSASVLAVPGLRNQMTLTGFWRPATSHGFFFFDGRLERIQSDAGVVTRTRLGASLQTDEARILPYARTERGPGIGDRDFAGLSTFMMPRPRWGAFLGQTLLRTNTEVERRAGLVSWSAFAAHPVARGVRLEVGAHWMRGDAGPTYTVTITSYFSALRSVTAVSAPPGEPVNATQFVQGSVLWDRRTDRLGVAPGPSLERSGLSGRVYLDVNANGIRDPGEPAIVNARVLVGSLSARTDSAGAYHIWDLVPFEPVMVSLDSLSLESPLLVPLFARTSIVPGPNRFRSLDIPVVEAGVIEGRVVRGSGGGVGGVTLILTDRQRGIQRTLVTFNDGGFYLMGVKPGDYELSVDERVLDALAVDAEPLRFRLAPTAGGIGRDGLELRLKSRF
jgi:hypothetical protein